MLLDDCDAQRLSMINYMSKRIMADNIQDVF
jgi:hypothetical protein